jgi:hypothetical protein
MKNLTQKDIEKVRAAIRRTHEESLQDSGREALFGPFSDPVWMPTEDQFANLCKGFEVTHEDIRVEYVADVQQGSKVRSGNAITGKPRAIVDTSKLHRCPRRLEGGPGVQLRDMDVWTTDNKCQYCGSIHPNDFMTRVALGEQLVPTDKNYKAYLGNDKFYFQHLSTEQQAELIRLVNEGQVVFGVPGYFYRLPFFMATIDKSETL